MKYKIVWIWKITQFLYLLFFSTAFHLSELQFSAVLWDLYSSGYITGYRIGKLLKINWNSENKNV